MANCVGIPVWIAALLAVTWISFNMTAVVCQLDKLVRAISPTGQWIAAQRACQDMREVISCQIERRACLLAPDWQPALGRLPA